MAIVGKPNKEPSVRQLIREVEDRISGGDGSPDTQERINLAVLETLKAIERKLPMGMI